MAFVGDGGALMMGNEIATACQYGGNPIVRGGRIEVVEGEGRARNVVIEFASFDAARAYAHSAEYAAARKLRAGAGSIDLLVVEGAS